jgi:predicted XRE-type DNA-binding protein
MRIRRALLEHVLEIANRDHLAAADIAHMCGTSRPRATRLLQRQIELFNCESLIDILFRMGVVLELKINSTRAYRRTEFDNPRARRRFVEPWRA